MRAEVARSLLSVEPSSGGFDAEFCFEPDLGVFVGHFPGHPIVPGVFLIEAVRCAAERVWERSLRLTAVTRAKFSSPVLPGERIRIEVRAAALDEGWECRAEILRGEGEGREVVSKARLRLH